MPTDKTQAWKRRRRAFRTALAILLLGGKCQRCGTKEGLVTHHVDPKTKSFGILSSGVAYGLDRFLAEIAKCMLLCRSCHGKTHEQRGDAGFKHERTATHGSTSGYRLGCRCEDCTRAHGAYNRKRKKKYRPSDLRNHGTTSEWSRGCRCDRCKAASRRYNSNHRKQKAERG